MLLLSLQSSSQNQNFDRRRKCGTTRASDAWSLGCLFYELLTGKFLFQDPVWARFFVRVTDSKQKLINEENEQALDNNKHLIDFLKYILIRNPRHRPTIDHIIRRFESTFHNLSNPSSSRFTDGVFRGKHMKNYEKYSLSSYQTSEALIQEMEHLASQVMYLSSRLESSTWRVPKAYTFEPGFMLMLKQIAICTKSFFLKSSKKLVSRGFSHTISLKETLDCFHFRRFRSFLITKKSASSPSTLTEILPAIFDFLRDARLYEGSVLFIEEDPENTTDYSRGLFIRELMTLVQASIFKCSVYEMWSLVNTQVSILSNFLESFLSFAIKIYRKNF